VAIAGRKRSEAVDGPRNAQRPDPVRTSNVPWRLEAYGPNTPPYARGTRWVEYGPNALFGIKGTF
jgi:hypothetical protein